MQFTFARSIDPIVAHEHSITRTAVATEAEAEKQQGDNRTMGRKHTVPYGLYRAHGFVSAFLAKQTGFRADDLELFWQALTQMFFEHASELGNAHAHALFDRLVVQRKGDLGPRARLRRILVRRQGIGCGRPADRRGAGREAHPEVLKDELA